MILVRLLLWGLLIPAAATAHADDLVPRELLQKSRRIVFLGDSITAAGQYVAYFDLWLTSELRDQAPVVIDCGLPSETVSGLSEDGHAGGKFPRPDLAERLDRVLAHSKPDLVIACYGINCGIYQPFDAGRFEKYQAGMKALKSRVEALGAKFVVMTPPFYDDKRSPRPFSYNEVLDRYAAWLIEQRKQGWIVIDLHVPMTQTVTTRRATEPSFTLQPDGVHPNDAGHWLIAQQLIGWAGDTKAAQAASPQDMMSHRALPAAVLPLVQQRVQILRDSYVGTAGHLRPGVARGLPVEQAEAKRGELTARILELLPERQ